MAETSISEKTVIQANPLIRARKEMNLSEMRLFILGLQDIVPHILDDHIHDVEFHETKISYAELMELFGGKSYGNISNLKAQVKKAYSSIIELSYPDGGFGFRHIYRKMDYTPQEGLTILFDDEIKPYILEILNQPYTSYKVKAFFLLSSTYAWRILESLLEKQGYLRQGQEKVFLVLTIEEVRFRLNIPDNLYKGRIDNFKKHILDLPIEEINLKTDYYVWYEVLKTGRQVTGFKFWLKLKDGVKANPPTPAKVSPTVTAPIPHIQTPTPAEPVPASVAASQTPTQAPTPVPIDSFGSSSYRLPMSATAKIQLMKAMADEGLTTASMNTYFKRDGEWEVRASFELAKEHADANEKTKIKGSEARKRYIKACLERGIAGINEEEKRVKKEIDEREKRLKIEKKKHEQELEEAFSQLTDNDFDLATNVENIGNITNGDRDGQEQSDSPVEKPQELPDSTVEIIIKLWAENGKDFKGMEESLKKYGHTPSSFYQQYLSKMSKLLG